MRRFFLVLTLFSVIALAAAPVASSSTKPRTVSSRGSVAVTLSMVQGKCHPSYESQVNKIVDTARFKKPSPWVIGIAAADLESSCSRFRRLSTRCHRIGATRRRLWFSTRISMRPRRRPRSKSWSARGYPRLCSGRRT